MHVAVHVHVIRQASCQGQHSVSRDELATLGKCSTPACHWTCLSLEKEPVSILLLHILTLLDASIPRHRERQLMHAAAVAEFTAAAICCCCCCVRTWSSVRMTMKLGLRMDGSALCAAAVTTLDTKAAQAEHDRDSSM
jgi:hypothetical protein